MFSAVDFCLYTSCISFNSLLLVLYSDFCLLILIAYCLYDLMLFLILCKLLLAAVIQQSDKLFLTKDMVL